MASKSGRFAYGEGVNVTHIKGDCGVKRPSGYFGEVQRLKPQWESNHESSVLQPAT